MRSNSSRACLETTHETIHAFLVTAKKVDVKKSTRSGNRMNYEVIHRELASLIICAAIHRELASLIICAVIHRELASLIIYEVIHRELTSRPRTKQFMLFLSLQKKLTLKKVPGAGIE